ncbi:MAG: hypothetical protein JNL45_16215 [Hyphomicrobium sp.]|nr:hypothetical protein [Hyphomicrobium sp.]
MQLNTIIRSPGALVLGLFFAGVTARTIFDDVWSGAPITISHLNALAALVAAVASGHFVVPAFLQKRLPAALELAAIMVGATAYVVTSSGARDAEVANAKAAGVLKTNQERASLRAKVAEAEADVETYKADLERAKADAARECASGKGKRCEGRVETRDWAAKDLERTESHAGLMRGKLALLGPEVRPFEGYHHAALVFEAAGLGSAAMIEARLELLMPFALVLITELSTIVFLGMALGRREPRGNDTEQNNKHATSSDRGTGQSNLEVVPDDEALELKELLSPAGQSGKPYGGLRAGPKSGPGLSRSDALDDIVQRLADGQTIPSQEALADDWGRPKQTVSDWLREWRRIGIVPKAVRAGRCKATMGE